MQQLPHQYGGELYDLYDGRDGSHLRQRQPVRLLPQRLIHRRRHRRARRARRRSPATSRPTAVTASPVTPGGDGLHQLGGRQVHPRGDRHQLLELPQRHHRDRHEDAAAYSGGRHPVQQLPQQYGGEFHDLHDGYITARSAPAAANSCHNGSFTGEGPRVRRARRRSPATSRPTAAIASPVTPAQPRPSPAGRAASSPTRRPIPTARAATTVPPRPA